LDKEHPQFEVLFNAEVGSTVSSTETATASLSYSYKGAEKTVDFPDVSVHTAKLELTSTDENGKTLNGGFALYRCKTKYDNNGRGTPKYYKFAEGTTGDMPLVFNGLGKGKYKLKYTTGLKKYASYNSVTFTIDAETDSTGIKSLKVINTSDNPFFSCTTDPETGTIHAAFVGITE